VLIYIISKGGIPDKERKQLFAAANLPPDLMDTMYGLKKLGVRTRTDAKKKQKKSWYFGEMQVRAIELAKSEIIQSRFEPLLSIHLKKFAKGILSVSEFPYFGKTPSDIDWKYSRRGKSLRSAKSQKDKKRIIVFVLGGISYSEIRQCYLLSQEFNLDMYIGSSHIMTPKQYVKLLRGPTDKDSSDGKLSRNYGRQ